jgi:phosphate transport system substrate-binding protein
MSAVKNLLMNKKRALATALLLGCSVVTTAAPAYADTTITIAGSTALLPLVKDAANAYQQAHPDVKISVSAGGSGAGIAQVAARAVNIGNSDITAPAHPELHDNRVAVVGFAVVAHPGIGVKNLTRKQLQDIFSGKTGNWKDVGGADQKIVVVNRPRSSGTRAVFTKTVMGGVPINESSLTEDATGTVVSVVKQTPGAISYAALSGTRGGGLTELAVDGAEPTEDNIVHGRYPIWSYEHMFTYGPPTGEISRFIAFVQSHSELVRKDGFILIRDMRVTEHDR